MKQIKINQQSYHGNRFDKTKLPDIKAAGYVSASLLSKVRNPIKFMKAEPDEETQAMYWGSLVDCLWTTPKLFNVFYAVLPEDAPRRPTEVQRKAVKQSPAAIKSIAFWDAWEKSTAGKCVVPADVLIEARKAVAMLKEHPISSEILANSQTQVVMMGKAPESLGLPEGVLAKGMMDMLPDSGRFTDYVVDLKTTNNLAENLVHNIMFQFDYVVKMSFYSILSEACGFGVRDKALLIWQNSKAPYEVKVRELGPNDIAFGKTIIRKRCEVLGKLDPNHIEAFYDTEIKEMPLKSWAIEEYNNE